MQCLLAERCRADRLRPTLFDDAHGSLDVAKRCFARNRGGPAERQIGGNQLEVDTLDFVRGIARFAGMVEALHLERASDEFSGPAKARSIADDQWVAQRAHHRSAERLHHDFGTNACGIAHGDCDRGKAHATVPVCLMKRSLSMMRLKQPSLPNPPALVTAGTETPPSVRPSGMPGSISSRSCIPLTPSRVSNAAAVSPPVAASALASRAAGPSRLASAETRYGSPAICEEVVEAMSTTTSIPVFSAFRIASESEAWTADCRSPPSSDGSMLNRSTFGNVVTCARAALDACEREPTTTSAPRVDGSQRCAELRGTPASETQCANAWARPALPMKKAGRSPSRLAAAIRSRSSSVSASQTATAAPSGFASADFRTSNSPRTVANPTLRARKPALSSRWRRLASAGSRPSGQYSVNGKATPCTRSCASRTVRPMAGKDGAITTQVAESRARTTSSIAAISSAGLPRSVESIFLNSRAGACRRRCNTSRWRRAADAASSSR